MPGPSLTPWAGHRAPTKQQIESVFGSSGLSPSWWSNGPGYRYATHSHPYHKVLYCQRGSIVFLAGPSNEPFALSPGDRLDVPPGTPHSALVGPLGVTCAEAAAH